MNLKGWKKILDADDSATFKHPNGSELKIAKKGLSKSYLENLSKLPLHKAEGDMIDSPEPQPMAPPAVEPPVVSEDQNDINQAQFAEQTGAPVPGMNVAPPQQPQPSAPMEQRQPASMTPEQQATMHAQEGDKEADAVWNDLLQGHIKPKTYSDLFAEKSTLGKIGTIFGLMVGGAGAGLAHQEPVLLKMMDKEIERDLEGQKESSSKMQNLYRLNIEKELNQARVSKEQAETKGVYKDIEAKALANTKNQMLLFGTHKILNDLNLLPDGPSKQLGMQKFQGIQSAVANQIKQNNAQVGQHLVSDPEGEFQKKQAALRNAGALGILPGADAIAQQNEDRHIPGFGSFTQAVPQEVKNDLIAKMEFDKAARRYADFAKKHSMNWANLNPIERAKIAAEGNALGAELQGKYRIKTKGGVYKESEQDFINKIIPENATSWKAFFSHIPKVTTAIETNMADIDNTAKSYGGEAPRYWNGKYYVRGADGKSSVEVK